MHSTNKNNFHINQIITCNEEVVNMAYGSYYERDFYFEAEGQYTVIGKSIGLLHTPSQLDCQIAQFFFQPRYANRCTWLEISDNQIAGFLNSFEIIPRMIWAPTTQIYYMFPDSLPAMAKVAWPNQNASHRIIVNQWIPTFNDTHYS